MSENETAAAVAEPEAPPAFGDDAPVSTETPAEAPSLPDSAEAPPAPKSWQTIYAELEADEAVKSEYDAHLDEVRQSSRKEGHSEAQKRLQPLYEQYRNFAGQSAQGIRQIQESLKEAIDNGADERSITKALQSNPEAWQAWNGLGHVAGTYDGAKRFVGMMAEGKLGEEYTARIDAILQGTDTAENVVGDLREAIIGDAVEKAKKPLQAKLREKDAEIERLKADGRDGKGPSNASPAVASGALTYDKLMSMTSAERTAVPAADKERLINEEQRRRSGG